MIWWKKENIIMFLTFSNILICDKEQIEVFQSL